MAAIAYTILQSSIVTLHGKGSLPARVFSDTWKEKLSPVCYFAAIGLAFVSPWISIALYAFVALLWIVPDKRVERLAQPK